MLQGYSALCALLLLASAEENKESKAATNAKPAVSEPGEKRQDKRGLEHDFGGGGGYDGGEYFGGKFCQTLKKTDKQVFKHHVIPLLAKQSL